MGVGLGNSMRVERIPCPWGSPKSPRPRCGWKKFQNILSPNSGLRLIYHGNYMVKNHLKQIQDELLICYSRVNIMYVFYVNIPVPINPTEW